MFNHRTHFKDIYGKSKPAELEYFGVFINGIKLSAAEFLAAFKDFAPLKMADDFYLFKNEAKSAVSASKYFLDGGIYIQDYASYLCAKSLGVTSTDTILDMCASPGGKTINLANFCTNSENLSANELNTKRFFNLKKILNLYCVRARTFNHDGVLIGRKTPERFSKILLDAPCSTFMHDFTIEKSHKEIKQIALTQKKLLNSALAALKSGGEMIYSTCTHNFYENEAVIFNALNSRFNIELLDIDLPCESIAGLASFDAKFSDTRLAKTRRIKPAHTHSGFFLAKIKKLG